jgi:hypothetical protein
MTSLNLDNIREALSKSRVDIRTPKIILAKITKGVRAAVINAVAKASDISIGAQTRTDIADELLEKGDAFPIIITDIIDPETKSKKKYIFPCGKVEKRKDQDQPLAWTNLVEFAKEDDSTLFDQTNMIVKDRPFSMDGVDKETIDRINYAMENPTDRSFFIEEFVVDIPEQIKTEPSEAKTASQPTGQQETTEKTEEDGSKTQNRSSDTDDKSTETPKEDNDSSECPREHRINSLTSNQKFRLPQFREHDNCDAWVKKSDFILKLGGVDKDTKKISSMCSHLPDAIQDTVILELASLDETHHTLEEFTKVLNRACKKNDIQYGVILKKLKFNPDTHLNLRNFYYRIKQLVKQTIGEESEDMLEKISFKEFLEKLPQKVQSSEMLLEYRKNKDKTIMDLVDKCSELYDNYKAGSHNEINHITRERGFKNKPFSPNNGKKSLTCHYCKKVGHIKTECRKLKADRDQKGTKSNESGKIVCHSCNKPGHKSFECRSNPNQKSNQGKSGFSAGYKPTSKGTSCRYCSKPGHFEKDCFKKKREQGRRESSHWKKQ